MLLCSLEIILYEVTPLLVPKLCVNMAEDFPLS